jgi:uncharacterized protein YndB with AHSA1/START domain
MTSEKHSAPDASRQIHVVRRFDAPRELVFKYWIDPKLIAQWFAPDGFAVTSCQSDPRPGGRWTVDYRSERSETFTEFGEFREIVAPEKIVLTLTQVTAGNRQSETLVTVTLSVVGKQTEMTFLQTGFDSQERRDGNAEGWNECFRKLELSLAAGGLSDS